MTRGLIDRRRFVKVTGAAGIAGLAGCLGESDDGPAEPDEPDAPDDTATPEPDPDAFDMVMVTSDSATAAFAMSQAMASVLNSASDSVFLDARPSEGTDANVGRLDRREAQIGMIQGWTAVELLAGNPPFEDIDWTPLQVFHLYDLPWVFATANDSWESITDIQPGSRVNPTPAGSGTAPPLELALDHAGLEYERASFAFGELGGAMAEGNLDSGAVTILNFAIEPGWLQEMKGTVDLRVLGVPDDVADTWRGDPDLLVQDLDMTEFDGYAYTPDVVPAPTLSYNFIVRDDMQYDAIYELLDVLYGARDGLSDHHAVLGWHADDEWWVTNMYEDMPFHPAAADFYEEQGIWRDEWERYDG